MQKEYHGLYKPILQSLKSNSNIPKDLAIEYAVDGDKLHAQIYPHVVPSRFVQMADAMVTIEAINELSHNLTNRDVIRKIGIQLAKI